MSTVIRLMPVPRRLARRWELATARPQDASRCAAFLDRVERMTRAEWLAEGRRALASGGAAPEAPGTDDALDALLARRGLGVTAWLVRDAVETAAHLALGTCDAGADRAPLEAARRAATRAALAQLVGPALARDV